MEKLAVIKIRSSISKSNLINKSLRVLGLKKLYSCTIINDSEVNRGILKNIESVITYGEIDANTLSKLLIKRGMISNKKRIANKT
jgi:large subunit ribosomal protein L30